MAATAAQRLRHALMGAIDGVSAKRITTRLILRRQTMRIGTKIEFVQVESTLTDEMDKSSLQPTWDSQPHQTDDTH